MAAVVAASPKSARVTPLSPRRVIWGLFLLSGCAGLIYEVVWTRELVFVFGGTTYAVTTILVAFMSGLGLGSYVAGRLSHRFRQPGRVYGSLEIAIGLYALLVPILLHAAEPVYRALYPHVTQTPWMLTAARFCIGFVIVVVPTTFMGATLPILVRYVVNVGQGFGRAVGLLYGINTLGATIGTAAGGFWLIPAFGLTAATRVAASINLLVGLAAITLLRQPDAPPRPQPAEKTRRDPKGPQLSVVMTPPLRTVILATFAISGFAAMVYQIAWTRVLVMSLGSSTYSFTCILTAFIGGLAIGSLVIARWVDRWRNPALVFGALEMAIGLAAVLIVPIYGQIPAVVHELVMRYRESYSALLGVEFLVVIGITLVPTFLMGAIFPLVTRLIGQGMEDPGAATGKAYAINTLGTIVGSFLAGFVMIRSEILGVQNSIVAGAMLNVILGGTLTILSRPAPGTMVRRVAMAGAAVLIVPVVAMAAGRWDREKLLSAPFYGLTDPTTYKEGQRAVYYKEGPDITVAVVEALDAKDHLSMSVNGKTDASTELSDMTDFLLVGHVPALLTDGGKKACVIGLGSGITLGALACYPSYERFDCIEISDDVVKAAAYFHPYNRQILTDDPRVHMIHADGRNHLLLTDQTYDLIVSQPSNPWMSGVANLFTKEFFTLCRNRLTENGRLGIWLQSYMMSVDDFQMVVRTLLDVFDSVSLWRLAQADYLLVAGHALPPVSLDDVNRRFEIPSVREDLYRVCIGDLGQLLGRFITSGAPLRQWVDSARVHTDDNAWLEFSAPRHIFGGGKLIIEEQLLQTQRSPFDEVLAASKDPSLQAAVQARIAGGVEARKLVAEAWAYGKKQDIATSFRRFVTAYQRNPGNAELYQLVREREYALNQEFPDLAQTPEMKQLFGQIAAFRPIIVTSKRGTKAADIARLLRSVAVKASEQMRWDWASAYLEDALSFDPTNGEIVSLLALSLAKTGHMNEAIQRLDSWLATRPEDGQALYTRARLAAQMNDVGTSISRLKAALRTGAVTPAALMADELLRPIRDRAEFQALLRDDAQSRPASRPS
jgi:spermidine synthase